MKRNRFKGQFFLSVCLTTLICVQMMGFLPSIPSYIIFSIGMFSVLCLLNKKAHIDKLSLTFLLLLPFTIILASPNPIFKSFERLLSFLPLYLIGSPLFQSKAFTKFRVTSFNTFLIIFVLLGVGSFFCYFLGINMMTMNRDELEITYQTAGYFSGLTKQSMMLGPVGGITALFGGYKYMQCKRKIYLLILIMGYMACIYSASRGAFVASTISLLVLLYKMSVNIKLYFKRLFFILILIGISSPIWISGTRMLQEKHNVHKDDLELFDSRADKFAYRFAEFISSPIYGVGFSAIDPNIGDKYSRQGVIEPGSSWLAILSMTGIFGAILFVSMYVRSLKRSLKSSFMYNKKMVLLSSILVLMSIHWIVEGYIFASGNTLCFFSWLILGLCFDKNINNEI